MNALEKYRHLQELAEKNQPECFETSEPCPQTGYQDSCQPEFDGWKKEYPCGCIELRYIHQCDGDPQYVEISCERHQECLDLSIEEAMGYQEAS